jgi:hypothetical protein
VANILFGAGIADARGAVGGIVFSRGGGGSIMRTKVKPVNPASEAQVLRRAMVSNLSCRWSATLTNAQRAAWTAYAAGTTWTNKLGQAIVLSGNQAYMYINGSRVAAGLALTDTCPLLPGVAITPSATITAEGAGNTITVVAAPTGFVVADPLNAIAVFAYLQTRAGSVSTYRRRKLMSLIPGNAVPPVFPQVLNAGQELLQNQNVPAEIILFDISQRVSAPFRTTVPVGV